VFDNLAYRVDGSKVTLFGQVRDPKLKSDAERAVKSIEGVSAIDNQIEVMPLSSMDDQTRMKVYRAIYSKSSLQRYQLGAVPPIHIIVKNGDVTLEGVVANEMDKNVAFGWSCGCSDFRIPRCGRTDSPSVNSSGHIFAGALLPGSSRRLTAGSAAATGGSGFVML
jgi:hypothetical protein